MRLARRGGPEARSTLSPLSPRFALKQGLPARIPSHNIASGNCVEAVSILVAGAVNRSGDKFFLRTRTEGGSYGELQQVVIVTGSHNLQILWLETGQGRTLQQFPFGYIVAEKMWAPVNDTFLLPSNMKEYYSTGAWNG